MSSRPSRGAARLAAILDALPDALLLVNCNGTVVNANAIALETFETPGTALVGRGLLDLLPSFDSKRIPGSMRRAGDEPSGRTKPTRMVARRTDGTEFPVEVTSANLEDGRTPYAQPDHYTGDELLMLVVRDLTGTLDTEAELARQQRQTEMILRAAAEGVVGVDTDGKVVLVNPSAAQILGYRATDLGGQELHPLVHHSRADGTPLPVEESPLTDTLRSGRKHRVRGVALWRKDGRAVPVDLTTAPVRDGDQLVGAVMTFTDRTRFDALAKSHEQLHALLDTSLRGPLDELRQELSGLAADPAGQLWPEANQILHHLAAGYARITTLIDNVLEFQRLEGGSDQLNHERIGLDKIVSAGVEGATELIGPGRAQYAVHAPPVEVALDGERMAQALAHLIADTVGVDATGNTGTGDSTVVVAAAQRGDVARIEVRGPNGGGHPVHLPIARGIVERHGGVLQAHEVPGQGSAYVLEVPITSDSAPRPGPASGSRTASGTATQGGGSSQGTSRGNETTVMPVPAEPVRGTVRDNGGNGTASGASAGGPDGADGADGTGSAGGSGASGNARGQSQGGRLPVKRQGQTGAEGQEQTTGQAPGPGRDDGPGTGDGPGNGAGDGPQGRRQAPGNGVLALPAGPSSASPGQSAQAAHAARSAQTGQSAQPAPVPAQPGAPEGTVPPRPTGRRRAVPRPDSGAGFPELPGAAPANGVPAEHATAAALEPAPPSGRRARRVVPEPPGTPAPQLQPQQPQSPQPQAQAQQPQHQPQRPGPPGQSGQPHPAQNAHPVQQHMQQVSVRSLGQGVPFTRQIDERDESGESSGGQAVLVPAPSGRRRKLAAPAEDDARLRAIEAPVRTPAQPPSVGHAGAPAVEDAETPRPMTAPRHGHPDPEIPQPEREPQAEPRPDTGPQPLPQSRQNQPRNEPQNQPQQQPMTPGGPPAPQDDGGRRGSGVAGDGRGAAQRFAPSEPGGDGRAFTIGAPAEGAEGPEHLDEVTSVAEPDHPDNDNPRRLLVWPEPDASTRQALTDRGYRPVIVRSREEVNAQIAEYPAALFVDPLTGPITRTALQSLRMAAVAAEVPVLVTAGLGQATREAAYGADPAVLLKALAPRDTEQHPSRVLLVEGHQEIATAFTATLERRGMQVAHAASEADAVTMASQARPNLVVMDLMLIRRRRVGIVDWLRGNGRLTRTPLVVYTSVDIDPTELPRLRSGETVLFLAERSTNGEVQGRIVDLLGKIGSRAPDGQ